MSSMCGAGACQDSAAQQQLVLYNPENSVLQALHQRQVTVQLTWKEQGEMIEGVSAPPSAITLEQGGRGTGGTTWVAGILLAQFLAMHNDNVFGLLPPDFLSESHTRQWKDATVVELGAGLGLVRLSFSCEVNVRMHAHASSYCTCTRKSL